MGHARQNPLPLFMAVFITLVAGISVAWLRPWHEAAPSAVVRVAYLPIYVDLPLFVAKEEEYFKDRGIEVELIRFQKSPDMAAALVSGKVDAIASIATSSILAVETRDPGRFKIFLVDEETPENPLSSLIVSSSSEINDPKDLKGKLIASFPGPTAKLFAPMALEKLGLAKDEYQIQEIAIGSHITALETGKVDAVVTYEPTVTQAVIKYSSRNIIPGIIERNVINPWQAGVWVVSSEFLSKRKDLANKFIYAIYDGVDLIRANPNRAKEALSSYTKIDPMIASKTPNIPFSKVWEADIVTLQKHADLLSKTNMLSTSIDIPTLIMSEIEDGN